MRYILKLTVFALLGLLLVSCSKSSSSSKHNASIKLQGVLEKGKATDGLCKIYTLDGKAYSKSNHIENGGYVASVPAGAFDVRCTINKYIDDITGDEVKPATSIMLEAISFAKAGKNKTVNVNVITDLVAKELMHSKGKIKDEKSFNSAKEDAKNTALKDILSTQSTIEDIDTLHLDWSENNILTKVSLAIQEQLDKPNSKITTVDQALTEAEKLTGADSIANQDVNKLSQKAIATPSTNIQPPTPTGQTQKITLTGATIGREDVATKPTGIDASNSVAFSIPTENLGDVADSDSVYITSDKAGQTKPIKLKGGKSAPYTASDVRDLFISDKVTTFTLCIVSTIKEPLKSEANAQCQSADRKVTFTATATSSTGGTGEQSTSTLIVSTIKAFTTNDGTTILRKPILPAQTGIDAYNPLPFSMPASLVTVASGEDVYITSDKANMIIKLEGGKTAPYTTSDVKSLFKNGEATTFTICVVPTMAKLDSTASVKCQNADKKANFTATSTTLPSRFNDLAAGESIIISGKKISDHESLPNHTVEMEDSQKISFSIPESMITKLPSESVYITSAKEQIDSNALPLTLEEENYKNADISSLLLPAGQLTTLHLCILTTTDTPDAALCRKSTTQKNLPVMVVGANSGFKPVTSAIMIGGTPLDPQGRTPTRLGAFTLIDNTEKITFSMPKTLVTKSPGEAVYITSSHSSMKERAIKLNLVDNNYEADIKNLIGLSHSTQLRLCIHAEDSSLTSEDCSDAKITITLPYIKYKT